MTRINKFFRLDAADRQLLVSAFFLVSSVRLGLSVLPFSIMRRLLLGSGRSDRRSPIASGDIVDRTVWAVTVASSYVPAATCLTQALAARKLLVKWGCDAVVRIGAARNKAGRFQAHAWVESSGKVVIGGSESSLNRFTELRTSDGGEL